MSSATACPSHELLEQVLLGLAGESDCEWVSSHLDECPQCVALADTLAGRDTLTEILGRATQIRAGFAPYVEAGRSIAERFQPGLSSAFEPTTAPPDTASGADQAFQREVQAVDVQPAKDQSDAALVSHLDPELYDFLSPSQAPDELGRLGHYRVLRVLGAGGMGVVFEAEDTQLKRRVALKAMKPGIAASASARKRFLREAQTAASVEHDHIVTVHQVGDDHGVPFIAMPLLRGETLADRLASAERGSRNVEQSGDKAQNEQASPAPRLDSPNLAPNAQRLTLPLSELLRITREIAAGLSAAHRRGLIHRDIKPGNIWLEAETGRVKILDFGLARAPDAGEQLTHSGALMGTPSYMAPEQARGEEVDARADLFSLGSVVYHMATGQRPFVGRDSLATLVAVTNERPRPPRELNAELPDEVEALVLKLLEKDPAARVQTAAEVVERVQVLEDAWRAGGVSPPVRSTVNVAAVPMVSPLTAVPTTSGESRSARHSTGGLTPPARQSSAGAAWPPRRTLAIALSAAAFVVLAGVIIIKHPDGSTTRIETDDDDEVTFIAKNPAPDVPEPDDGGDPGDAPDRTNVTTGESKPQPVQNPQSKIRDHLPPLGPLALVKWPAPLPNVKSWSIEAMAPIGYITASCALRGDGELVAVGSRDGHVRVFECRTQKLVKLLIRHESPVIAVDWSRDGRLLASADRDRGEVCVWDVRSGKHVAPTFVEMSVESVVWSPDGSALAVGGSGGVRLIEPTSGELLPGVTAIGGVYSLSWSPDGKHLAGGAHHGAPSTKTTIWNIANGVVEHTLPSQGIATDVAWSPDRKTLVAAPVAGDTISVWNTLDGTPRKTLHVPNMYWPKLHWLDEGTTIGVHCSPNEWQAWNVDTGDRVHDDNLMIGPCRSAEGDVVVSIYTDIDIRDSRKQHTIALGPIVNWAELSPMGEKLAVGDSLGGVWVWNESRLGRVNPARAGYLSQVHWLGKLDSLVCLRVNSHPSVFSLQGTKWDERRIDVATTITHGDRAVSVDGTRLACTRADGDHKTVGVWDLASRRHVRDLEPHIEAVTCLAWSPDGAKLALDSDYGTSPGGIWDAQSGKRLHSFPADMPRASRIAWSPDGALIAMGCMDETVRICDTDGTIKHELGGHASTRGYLALLSWSDDSKMLWTADNWHTRSWRATDGELVDEMKNPAFFSHPEYWTMSADPQRIVIPSGALRICDAATGDLQVAFVPLRNEQAVAISPDGHYRGTAGVEREIVYVVETDTGQEVLSPKEFEKRYDWKNEPERITLAAVNSEPLAPARPDPMRGAVNEARSLPSLSAMALVTAPAKIDGVESWTVETISHRGAIHQAVFSPDGELLATRADDAVIRIWNSSTGHLVRVLIGCDIAEGGICWSNDGRRVAAADGDKVRIWDMAGGKLAAVRNLEGVAHAVGLAWSPDSCTLAVLHRSPLNFYELGFFDAETGDFLNGPPRGTQWGTSAVNMRWSADGSFLAFSTAGNGSEFLVDFRTGKPMPLAPMRGIMDLVWVADGPLMSAVQVGEGDKVAIEVQRAETGEVLHRLAGDGEPVTLCGFSHDGKTLLATAGHYQDETRAYVWDTSTGRLVKKLDLAPDDEPSTRYAISPGGRTVAAVGPRVGNFRVLEVATGRAIRTDRTLCGWNGHGSIRLHPLAAWSPDGQSIAIQMQDEGVCLWNAANWRPRAHCLKTTWMITSLAWAAEEATGETRVRAWNHAQSTQYDGTTGQMLVGAGIDVVGGVFLSLSADGALAALADAHQVRIHQTETGRLLRTLDTESKFPPAFSRDGKRLATVAERTTIWNVETGDKVGTLDAVGELAWSPDGKRLACTVGNGQGLEVWDADENAVVVPLANDEAVITPGVQLAWSLDSTRIAGFGRVWDAQSGKLICALERFGLASTGAPAWSPDGAHLAYEAPDGATTIAETATGKAVASLVSFTRNRTLAISAQGHFRASPRVDEELIYIVQTKDGQEIMNAAEFKEEYGWKNDPTQVGLAAQASGGRTPPGDAPDDVAVPNAAVAIVDADKPIQNPIPARRDKTQNRLRPLGPLALVQQPAPLPNVKSWSIEALAPVWYGSGSDCRAVRTDGKLVAIGSRDGHVRVFEWKNRKLIKLLIRHESPVIAVDWSRDGRFLASADRDRGEVCVWDADTGKLVSSTFVAMPVTGVALSPTGDALAVCGVNGVLLVEPTSGELLPGVAATNGFAGLSWSPDGKRLAGGAEAPHPSKIWDVADPAADITLATQSNSHGTKVAWSPDGKTLVSAHNVGDTVCVWNALDGTLRKMLHVPNIDISYITLHWLDKGTTIGLHTNVPLEGTGLEAWNIETGERVHDDKLKIGKLKIGPCRSADGDVIVSGDIPLDVQDSWKHWTIELNPWANSADMSSAGEMLAVGDSLGGVWAWNKSGLGRVDPLTVNAPRAQVHSLGEPDSLLCIRDNSPQSFVFSLQRKKWAERAIDNVTSGGPCAVSADGTLLACTRADGVHKTISVLDLASGLHVRDLEPHSEAVSCLAWSPHGAKLAIDSMYGTTPGGIWDAQTGKRLHSFPVEMRRASRIAWSPDGASIALGCMDGTVRICDQKGTVIRELANHASATGWFALLSWSADSMTLWTENDRRTRSWRAADGTQLSERKNSSPFAYPGFWTMSADSRRIIAPSGAVRIFDSATGDLEVAFLPLCNERAVAISSDGHYRGTKGVEREIVYVVETDAGQEVLSPKEFEKRYDWTNDPQRVKLGGEEEALGDRQNDGESK